MPKHTVRSTYANRDASVPLVGLSATAAVGLFLALFVGLGLLGIWWFGFRVNAEAEIRRDSFNFQVTAEEQVIKLDGDLAGIDTQLADPNLTTEQKAALTAQRTAIARTLCDTAARLNDPKPVAAGIIAEEC